MAEFSWNYHDLRLPAVEITSADAASASVNFGSSRAPRAGRGRDAARLRGTKLPGSVIPDRDLTSSPIESGQRRSRG